MVKITNRPTTVAADLPGKGQGAVKAQSGADLALAGLATDDGLTPLELMDAALAGCLALSVRIAAREFGWQHRLGHVHIDVMHEKAAEAPSRIGTFSCRYTIDGDFGENERQELIARAHDVCTVGNTLAHSPDIRQEFSR